MQLALGSLVLTVALVVPTASGARQEPQRFPVTTLASVRGVISHFAQDGDRIAWHSRSGFAAYVCAITLQDLRSNRRWHGRDSACDYSYVGGLALGGRRVLGYSVGPGTVTHIVAWTWTPGQSHEQKLREDYLWEYNGGIQISDVAADGPNLVYGTLGYRVLPEGRLFAESCYAGLTRCSVYLTGGTVERVGRRSPAKLVAVPPSRLAVSGRRVALIPKESRGCACNDDPSWSPDGKSITFGSRRIGPDTEVSTVSTTGGRPTDLTVGFLNDHSPDWSPDGKMIVFVAASDEYEFRSQLRTIEPSGKHERLLFNDCSNRCSYPKWSPDGLMIVFLRSTNEGSEILAVGRDGSGPVRVALPPDPTWSPDGRTIAFAKCHFRPPPDECTPYIWLVDSDGSNERQLVEGWEPTWSSAGRIAFSNTDDNDSELYSIRPDGTDLRQITDNAVSDYAPDWAPDGSQIAFVRSPVKKPAQEIYVVNADGTDARRVTTTRSRVTHFPVEVHRAGTGALLSRFVPRGSAIDVAISQRFGATITRGRHGRTSVEVFRTASGARLGSIRVPRGTNSISIAGRTVVFASGHKIWALDAVRRKPSVVAVAREQPIDLSIEGRRVAWAESTEKRSRIRALWLPVPR